MCVTNRPAAATNRVEREESKQDMPGAILRRDVGLYSDDEIASMLNISVNTLQQWRVWRMGPNYVKLGKSVFYRRIDLEKWIERNAVMVEQGASDDRIPVRR